MNLVKNTATYKVALVAKKNPINSFIEQKVYGVEKLIRPEFTHDKGL